MRLWLLGSMLALLLLGCSSSGNGVTEDSTVPDVVAEDTINIDSQEFDGYDAVEVKPWPYEFKPVVFAIVSDIHLDGSFEDSIAQKVVGLLAKAASAEPVPEFIAITGDLTDQMAEPVETSAGSIIEALQKVIASSPVPVEPVLGNHDYYAKGDAIFQWTPDPQTRTKVFEDAIGLPAWHYTVHGGMKFIHLNSLIGPEAKKSIGLNGSLGKEQAAWLDQTLSDGIPAILFLHHPPTIVLEEDGDLTLQEIVSDHALNILAIFVGHIHVWASSTLSGVPVYITPAGFRGQDFHHVRVDPETGTVEILNIADIDYGETEQIPCEPDRSPGLEEPDLLAGHALILQVPDGHISPMGLGTYLRELVAEIPMALFLDLPNDQDTIPAYLAVAKTVGDGTDEVPPHLAPVPDGTCVPISLAMDGPCFESSSASLTIDLGKVLGFPLPNGWFLRARLVDLTLSGALLDGPEVVQGVLRATIDFNLGSEDLQGIIVTEYCAQKIGDCIPGTGPLPECPEGAGPEFYPSIPNHCDVHLLGVGLRTIFDIFASVPGLAVELDANFTVYPATSSEEATPGTVAPDLFDSCVAE